MERRERLGMFLEKRAITASAVREAVAREMRRRFNVENFDRDDDAGWEAELDAASTAIEIVASLAASFGEAVYCWHDDGIAGFALEDCAEEDFKRFLIGE